MKRLHWYVIKSFMGPFFMTFFIVLFVLLMQFLWKYVDDMVGKGIEFKVLAEMLFYASFALLPYAFPLAMLLASIMTFGSLGENYELVAMKSSGISLTTIMKPLFIIAVIITLLAFYFANDVLPRTNLKFTTLLVSIRQQRPELILQEGVFINEMDGYSIKIGHKDKNSDILYDLLIYDHTKNKSNKSVTVADSGSLKITEDKKYMVLDMYDGIRYAEEENGNRRSTAYYPFRTDTFSKQKIRVPVRNFDFTLYDENVFKNTYRMLNIKQLSTAEDSLSWDYYLRLRKYIRQININEAISKKIFNLTALNDSLKNDLVYEKPDTIFGYYSYFNGLEKWRRADIASVALGDARQNMQNLNIFQRELYDKKKTLNKYDMETHRKFTLSIAVLIFFFIGAPLGAIIRKGGLGMPVVISILLFIAYYIVSMTGEKSAREDVWNMFSGMWFSSFVFLPVGIWLSYKATTDSAIMSAETYSKILGRLRLGKFRKKMKD